MATFVYPPQQVTIPGAATEATLLLVEQNTADTVVELQTLNANVSTADKQDDQSALLTSINQAVHATFFTLPFVSQRVTAKTADGPTQIVTYSDIAGTAVVQTLDITYDVDGDYEFGVVS